MQMNEMMKRATILFLMFSVFFIAGSFQGDAQDKSVQKVNISEIPFFDSIKKADQLHVFLFLGTDCPISQKYVHTLKSLYNTFPEVTFYGIIPHHFNEKEIKTYQEDYEIPFQLYRDAHNSIAKIFSATITPEAFLIDSQGTVYYQGAIDNWFYALGKNRPKATEHYLKRAIEEVSALQTVTTPRTDAIGCLIEMKH